MLTTCQSKFFHCRTFAPEINKKVKLKMEIITIESGIWQQLISRIGKIERFVVEATQPFTIKDEDLWKLGF